jgi:hypothetical protein
VWSRAVTAEGINHELGPWIKMTMPRGLRGRDIDDLEVPAYPGRSWLLLLGVIPFDYDDLGIEEIGPGHRFRERSTMLSMRSWEHERTVTPSGSERCRVTDRVAFEPRSAIAWLPGADRVARALIARVFARRHRRLRAAHEARG